jgi:hypothetical protein
VSTWNPWDGPDQYLWVVICKNHKFHNHQNIFSGHKIPLGETDAFAPPPKLENRMRVRCDECGEEHSYGPTDVVRLQMEVATDFRPHPLFL